MTTKTLPDDVREMIESLNETACLTHGKKAADMLERLQQRIEELTEECRVNGTALNTTLLSLKEAQRRIAELEGENDDLHSKLKALAPEDYA